MPNGHRDPRKDFAPLDQDSWRVFKIMAEFVDGFSSMSNLGPAVTIFGSARLKPSNKYYRACQETAKGLVDEGFAVITGGGPGIMEAGNKGAFEHGGTSVGANIVLPHEQDPNRFQTISVDFNYFYARKVMLVKYATGFIYFPGGYGTLDEFFETIVLIQTHKMDFYPMILFGSEFWGGLIEWMKKRLEPEFINPDDLDIFKIVDDPAEAIALVKKGIKKPWWQSAEPRLAKPTLPKGK